MSVVLRVGTETYRKRAVLAPAGNVVASSVGHAIGKRIPISGEVAVKEALRKR
jgi:hypothetical protein